MAIAVETRSLEGAEGAQLTSNLGWLLHQASHNIATELAAAFESLGVPPRGHCVLSVARTGTFTQKELADTIGIDKTTMVVTIDELEQAGLAERRPSETDRRARVIHVTSAGRKAVERGDQLALDVQEDVLAGLPARQRAPFMAALSELVCTRLADPATCQQAPRRRA